MILPDMVYGVATALLKVPELVRSPDMVPAPSVPVQFHAPPLEIFRFVVVTVAATDVLIAPPLLMIVAPSALVAVAPFMDRIPVTEVLAAVSPSVLVVSVPVFMVRLLVTDTAVVSSVTATPVFLLMVRLYIPAGDVVPMLKLIAVPPVKMISELVVVPDSVPLLVYVPAMDRLYPASAHVPLVIVKLFATVVAPVSDFVLALVTVRLP